jgi:ribonuclease HI
VTKKVEIYTDGASSGNPGPGGFGAILKYGSKEKELSRGFRLTTNNRMELMAVIEAIKCLKEHDLQLEIYSDSSYVVNAIEKGWLKNWLKKPNFNNKANKDLWMEYDSVSKNHKINLHWIRGHSGHIMNERCDKLAVEASKSYNLEIDYGYEQTAKKN